MWQNLPLADLSAAARLQEVIYLKAESIAFLLASLFTDTEKASS